MSELVEFLLARIAEDEAVARAAAEQHDTPQWRVTNERLVVPDPAPGNSYVAVGPWDGGLVEEQAAHIAHWDPARVLAECEAKRRIVSEVELIQRFATPGTSRLSLNYSLDRVLRYLAQPYADHPDFREEWRA